MSALTDWKKIRQTFKVEELSCTWFVFCCAMPFAMAQVWNQLSPFGEQAPWLSLSKDKHAALQIKQCNMSLEILKGNSRVTFIWCLFIFKDIIWAVEEENCGCNGSTYWRPVLGHSWRQCISFLVAIACSLCVLDGWNKCFYLVTV